MIVFLRSLLPALQKKNNLASSQVCLMPFQGQTHEDLCHPCKLQVDSGGVCVFNVTVRVSLLSPRASQPFFSPFCPAKEATSR